MDEVTKRIEEAKVAFNTKISMSTLAINFIRLKTKDGLVPLDLHTINVIKKIEEEIEKGNTVDLVKTRKGYELVYRKKLKQDE